jgi:hypothetical protein
MDYIAEPNLDVREILANQQPDAAASDFVEMN